MLRKSLVIIALSGIAALAVSACSYCVELQIAADIPASGEFAIEFSGPDGAIVTSPDTRGTSVDTVRLDMIEKQRTGLQAVLYRNGTLYRGEVDWTWGITANGCISKTDDAAMAILYALSVGEDDITAVASIDGCGEAARKTVKVNVLRRPAREYYDLYLDVCFEGGCANSGLEELFDVSDADAREFGFHACAITDPDFTVTSAQNSTPFYDDRTHKFDLVYELDGNFWYGEAQGSSYSEMVGTYVDDDMGCALSSDGTYDFSSLSASSVSAFNAAFDPYSSHSWLIWWDSLEERSTVYDCLSYKIVYKMKRRSDGFLKTSSHHVSSNYGRGVEEKRNGHSLWEDRSGNVVLDFDTSYTDFGDRPRILPGVSVPVTVDTAYELLSITFKLEIGVH